MKKTLCTLLAILMATSMISCGKQTTPETPVTQEKPTESKTESENNIPKEPKNYTLMCIPSTFMDDEVQDSTEFPKSLIDNVTIQYQEEADVVTSFSNYGTTLENSKAESTKTLTIDGETYKYTFESSVANEWAQSQVPSVLEYAYFDNYTCNDPKSTVSFNSKSGKLTSFVRYDVNCESEGDIGEKAISQKADELLLELYGNEYLNRYTKTVEYVKYSINTYEYIVLYRRNYGKYLGDDWVRFHFSPKGELKGINARYLNLLADFDFTEEDLDDAKEAMFSAIYSDPNEWHGGDILLTIDGLTGTCYMETYVFSYNGKEVEWRFLLALN